MGRYQCLRKCFSVGIIILYIGTCLIPSTAKSIVSTANIEPRPVNFFGLKSNIEISWDANDTEEPLTHRGGIRTVDMNLSFWVTWGIFGRLINYLNQNRVVNMKMSIVDTPEWCSASLSEYSIEFLMPKKENTKSVVTDLLYLYVSEDAPAFELFPIAIQATMEPLDGLFGLITVMQGTVQVVNITFTVAYRPLIKIDFPEGIDIEVPPLVQVELPIGITNLGNGRTIVINELVYFPSDWIVTLPSQVTLETYEYKEINLTIIAPFFYGERFIVMSFTPHSYYNYSLIGETYTHEIIAYYYPP